MFNYIHFIKDLIETLLSIKIYKTKEEAIYNNFFILKTLIKIDYKKMLLKHIH